MHLKFFDFLSFTTLHMIKSKTFFCLFFWAMENDLNGRLLNSECTKEYLPVQIQYETSILEKNWFFTTRNSFMIKLNLYFLIHSRTKFFRKILKEIYTHTNPWVTTTSYNIWNDFVSKIRIVCREILKIQVMLRPITCCYVNLSSNYLSTSMKNDLWGRIFDSLKISPITVRYILCYPICSFRLHSGDDVIWNVIASAAGVKTVFKMCHALHLYWLEKHRYLTY